MKQTTFSRDFGSLWTVFFTTNLEKGWEFWLIQKVDPQHQKISEIQDKDERKLFENNFERKSSKKDTNTVDLARKYLLGMALKNISRIL